MPLIAPYRIWVPSRPRAGRSRRGVSPPLRGPSGCTSSSGAPPGRGQRGPHDEHVRPGRRPGGHRPGRDRLHRSPKFCRGPDGVVWSGRRQRHLDCDGESGGHGGRCRRVRGLFNRSSRRDRHSGRSGRYPQRSDPDELDGQPCRGHHLRRLRYHHAFWTDERDLDRNVRARPQYFRRKYLADRRQRDSRRPGKDFQRRSARAGRGKPEHHGEGLCP